MARKARSARSETVHQHDGPAVERDSEVPKLKPNEAPPRESPAQEAPPQEAPEPREAPEREETQAPMIAPNHPAPEAEAATTDTQPADPVQATINNTASPRSPRPSPAPSAPSAPGTKKRLTLQERLALAAKGRKATKVSHEGATPSESAETTPEPTVPTSPPVTTTVVVQEHPDTHTQPVDDELARLRLSNAALQDEVARLKSSTKVLAAPVASDRELLAKLATRESTIEQLLREGEALSKKELKLNETIKRLRAVNGDLEGSLEETSQRASASEAKLSEIDATLKSHRIASVELLAQAASEAAARVKQLEADAAASSRWEAQFNEQLKRNEAELEARQQAQRDFNESQIQAEIARKQHALELETKDTLIASLKREVVATKEESSREMARLEGKIEQLRSANEEAVRQAPAAIGDGAFREFAALSDAHHTLQQQYLASQETWKSLESALTSKVEQLTSSVEMSNAARAKAQAEAKRLQQQLGRKAEECRELGERVAELARVNEELAFEADDKDHTIADLQERFDTFKRLYNNDRASLSAKVAALTESLAAARAPSPPQQYEAPPSLQRGSSSLSINLPDDESSLSEVRFGESCSTPAMSRDASAVFLHANGSSASFGSDGTADGMAGDAAAASGLSALGAANGHIQLINKMSATIRRLETELNTLRGENSQLARDKERIQLQVIEKLALQEEVERARCAAAALESQLGELRHKEQTMLEIIGEKTEQVEELRADVADLKELCRSQVQQMVGP
ncbi:TATA element modulatory factor 1 TATA binding domain-containing protein [[Candida] zeylanoides]